MHITTPQAEIVRQRYELNTVRGVTLYSAKDAVKMLDDVKPKGGMTMREAAELINKIESEEAGIPMHRSVEELAMKQLTHDKVANTHEREAKKVERLQSLEKRKEGAYNEKHVDHITGKLDREGNRIK
jgi:hypothetical protein